jgi:hypothetical protein
MDRVLASEARGCWFDPSRAHHFFSVPALVYLTGQSSDGVIPSLCLTASHASLWLNLGLKGAPPSKNGERLLDRSNSRFALCRMPPEAAGPTGSPAAASLASRRTRRGLAGPPPRFCSETLRSSVLRRSGVAPSDHPARYGSLPAPSTRQHWDRSTRPRFWRCEVSAAGRLAAA